MSESESAASDLAQEGLENASIYDFLYYDSQRVSSFLAQADANGALTSISTTEGVQKGSKRAKRFKLGAHSTLHGGAQIELEHGPATGAFHGIDREYDPLWANALSLLDMLEERGLVDVDIERGALGSFVLVQGKVSLSDFSMYRGLWDFPLTKTLISETVFGQQEELMAAAAANLPKLRHRGKHPGAQKQPMNDVITETFISILKMMPHTAQVSLRREEGESCWGTLRPDALVVPASDSVLKHGTVIPGEWHMLAILDASPFETESDQDTNVNLLGQALNALAGPTRNLLGRPEGSYGVTPLLIFREVK